MIHILSRMQQYFVHGIYDQLRYEYTYDTEPHLQVSVRERSWFSVLVQSRFPCSCKLTSADPTKIKDCDQRGSLEHFFHGRFTLTS